MGDESRTVTIVLSSLDDVYDYHELPRKRRRTSSNAALKHSIRRTLIAIANLTHLKGIKKVWAIGYLP